MQLKRLYIIIAILLSIHSAFAQSISVESFTLAPTDLTANTPGTLVNDQNGNVCALIKVETTQKGFTFDVGVLGVTSIVEQPAEIWVYVPFGIRKITIQHPQLGILRDYQLPCSIDRGRTYIMKLTSGTVKTIVEQSVSKQFLYIELDPAESILEINGKIKATNNGRYQELLSFGKYQYKVYCKDYHDHIGIIEISDPNNTHNLNVNLKPAFGKLTISESRQPDIKGAAVYIDENYAGTIPINNFKINSGKHQIKIIKELYEVFNGTFNMTDDENKVWTPVLNPDFAEVTLCTNAGSSIYINDEYKSLQSWSGKLALGSYIFESRQNGHIAYKMPYEITRDDQGKTITIPDPTPIYGSLVISSEPSKAKISINGEYIGDTPKYIGKHIVGEYSVSISLEGYESQTKTITVTESNETSISFSLKKREIDNSANIQTSTVKNGKRTITSQQAVIYIGEIIEAKLPEGSVERWEIESYKSAYVTSVSKKSFKAEKEGNVQLWGYVNGSPKLFKFDIKKGSRQAPTINLSANPQGGRMIYSKEATIKVGEKIYATLSEGFVERWDIEKYASSYITANNDGSITALKEGSVRIWGYINDKPKYFSFKILASDAQIAEDKPPYRVTSKTFSMKVGDHITAKLEEGEVTKWELEKHNTDYFSVNNKVLTAKKVGKVRVWGHINGKPKLFEITITQ